MHNFQGFVKLLQMILQLISKAQFHKIQQSRGFWGRPLGPLLKTGLPLIDNVLKPLGKSILIPLGLITAASATDAATHKKMFGSGFTTSIVSNEEMNGIMKIGKFLKDSGLVMKGFSKTIQNEVK